MRVSARRSAACRALVAVLLAVVGLGAPAGAQLVEPGPETVIREGTEGSAGQPDVAIAPDGRSAVAWQELLPPDGTEVIRLQLFGPGGEPDGAPVEVVRGADPRFTPPFPPALAAGVDGSFLVVWHDDSVRSRTVEPGGALGPERVVAEGAAFGHESLRPAVAGDPRGGFVVAWRSGGPEDRIVLRRLDGTGAAVGPEWQVVAVGGSIRSLLRPALSVGPAGGVVVIWRAEVFVAPVKYDEIHGRWFAPDGSPLGDAVGLGTGGSVEGAGVTHLSNGDVLTTWVGRSSSPPPFHELVLRRFDASGRLLQEELLDLPGVNLARVGRVAAAPVLGGGALLAWRGDRANEALLVDGSLARAGEVTRVSSFDFGGARSPALASDAGSEVFAVWQAGGPSFGAGVYGRRLRVAAGGALSFAEPTHRVGEGGGPARLAVRRIGFAQGPVSVGYRAEADSAEPGEDFQPVQGTLSWAAGDASGRTIELPILQDPDFEGPEVVRVVLSEPTGGAVLGELREAQVVIEDDDGRPATGGAPAPVTPGEVACDRARVEGLLDRIELFTPGSSKTAGVNLSLTASGDFAGVAYTGNGPITAEHHLAFSTDPEVTPLLLNPERPQLPAVALTRNPVNSDLVPPGDRDALTLRLRPTLGAETPPPTAFLVIDNLEGTAGEASQVKPGRGLAGLLAPCHHGLLVARDVHVLRVLAKIARLEVPGAARTELALYRAPEIDAYGLDARAFDGGGRLLGTLVARLTVTYTVDGALQGGELALVPACPKEGAAGRCTTLERPGRLLLVRPAFTGELWEPTPYRVETPAGSEGDRVAVDWSDLLAGATWRRAR